MPAPGQATDIIFTLVSIEVYRLLTGERGWAPDAWENWVATTITTTLFA